MRGWIRAWGQAGLVASMAWAAAASANDHRWADHTASARPLSSVTRADARLYALCGAPDNGLVRVASSLVARQLAGQPPPESARLGERLRMEGLPYMWPRVWMLAGPADPEEVRRRMERWQMAGRRKVPLRCGVARGQTPQGGQVVVAVQSDVLADLGALPTKARRGQWLKLDVQMRVAATQAKVMLLPPRGRPRRVLTSLSPGGRVRSRFAVDQAGRWLVPVVATTATGPTPVIEAPVFVGVPPHPAKLRQLSAPPAGASDDGAIFGWLNEVRKRENLPPLSRDPALDRLASAHSAHMIRSGRVAHQLGDGNAADRAHRAGLFFTTIGENVARAATPQRAHLALHSSPSHRATMLIADFERVGLAAVRGPAGRLWVTQIFAGRVSRARALDVRRKRH